MQNYYQILGVQTTATNQQVKLAYLKLSKKLHPDANNGDDYFTELFRNVNEAYTCLMDDAKRQRYNMQLQNVALDTARFADNTTASEYEPVYVQPSLKNKLFARASLSLLGGIAVIALFSFAFDAGNNVEMPHNSKIRRIVELPATKISAGVKATVNMSAIFRQQKKGNRVKTALPLTAPANSEEKVVVIIPAAVLKKLISENDMRQFLTLIEHENNQGTSVKSIRLLQSANSNITNAFDFARYLQAKGYVIAGRETITRPVQGVQVKKDGASISFTVGKL